MLERIWRLVTCNLSEKDAIGRVKWRQISGETKYQLGCAWPWIPKFGKHCSDTANAAVGYYGHKIRDQTQNLERALEDEEVEELEDKQKKEEEEEEEEEEEKRQRKEKN
ncbi:hypothetical protein M8J77_010944 [Diaphorina citri]|nr:hypothetical protein M8J77_010944 [Diaphorina citri]